MVASVGINNTSSAKKTNGMRPVNLSTDLGPLADLIELVFANTMDSGGRAALREMRMLSRLGPGAHFFSRVNDLALGVQQGFVWIEDGKLIGNVSIYPAKLPHVPSTWIVANVGTHPDYQRRGIARRLMQASMAQIKKLGGQQAVLQVDYDNYGAQALYAQLGFVEERAWTVWRRGNVHRLPPPPEIDRVFIAHRRRNEWQAEYAMAQRLRPQEQGGLGWLRPTQPQAFRRSLLRRLDDLVNLRSVEHLVIRDMESGVLHASLRVERGMGTTTRLVLMVEPRLVGLYDEALISTAVRRFGSEPLRIEHPYDETTTNQILERYHFRRYRSALHMRWDVR